MFYLSGKPCPLGHFSERNTKNGSCRECRKQNPERNRANARVWAEANRERNRAKTKAWRQANPVKKLAKDRAWRAKNSERESERIRDWQRNNKDKVAIRNNKWQAKNPDSVRAKVLRYRARLSQAPGRHAVADVERMLETQGYRCAAPHCGCEFLYRYHVDHITPLSRGGSGWPDNLQLLCGSCNSSKRDMTMEEWLSSRSNAT